MSSEIRDINLAESGEQKIEWVRRNCDLLRMLEEEFSQSKPFAGKKVTLSVHLEAKTAYLCKVLAAGDGHPAEIMDMSFAIQALSAKYLVEHGREMTEMLIDVPVEIDEDVAARKLRFMGKEIDTLTAEQEAYLNKSLV